MVNENISVLVRVPFEIPYLSIVQMSGYGQLVLTLTRTLTRTFTQSLTLTLIQSKTLNLTLFELQDKVCNVIVDLDLTSSVASVAEWQNDPQVSCVIQIQAQLVLASHFHTAPV